MLRSVLKLAQTAAKASRVVGSQIYKPAVVNFPVIRQYSSVPEHTEYDYVPLEQHDAAWIDYFMDEVAKICWEYLKFEMFTTVQNFKLQGFPANFCKEMDNYSFIVGFMELYGEEGIPEPKILQSALYACRRLDNFPMAMRVLEMIRFKCDDREDIYNYVMQELKPTLEDIGLPTVEELGLHQVED